MAKIRLRRPAAVLLAALVLATSTMVAYPTSVAAHCPGTAIPNNGRDYSGGWRDIAATGAANAIRGYIEWVNPNVCTTPAGNAFSLEVVNICNTGSCGGWVQVGWRKDQGEAAPSFYCEYHYTSGANTRLELPLAQGTHHYQMAYDSFDSVWDCYLDGAGKFARGSLGFTSGTWLVVQGEVNATHGQIGKTAPAKLLISSMGYRKSGSWFVFDVTGTLVETPYGGEEPQAGWWRNWTNAH